MGGSKSEEFLSPSAIGEDTFVRSKGGYAANVEAVQTVAPKEIDFSSAPAAEVHDSPNTPTIKTLVDLANAKVKKADGSKWTAADTLKNVVLAVTSAEGKREIVIVGIPGDREVDQKRAEAFFGTDQLTQATDEDFVKHKLLVKGYIGPSSSGSQFLGSKAKAGIKYLVDPRVVRGSTWVTGANESEKHVFGLVMGRDFDADGIADIAEVREGDLAPDGSGELELARGIEIGHVFQLGRKYAEALDLKVLDENGKLVTVTMGSYGIGVTRLVAVLAEANNDDKGLIWPSSVSPADVHIVAAGKDDSVYEAAEKLANQIELTGKTVLLDDRAKVSPGVKFSDAELIGIPTVIVVGKGLETGEVEIWNRRTGEREAIKLDSVMSAIK
jgi:prolyl-tRNA synthetase